MRDEYHEPARPAMHAVALAEPGGGPAVDRVDVDVFRVPTDAPESDGTFAWNATTIVVVHVGAGGHAGLGYTYADAAAGRLIAESLASIVMGRDTFAVTRTWTALRHAVRNLGRPGVASMAISAVDVALWDLKARLLGLPLVTALDAVHETVPLYGSGGFTSYPIGRLQRQLADWVAQGIPRVKMKIGRDPAADLTRVRAAREAIGADAELFVDANGAYDRKQALWFAERFADLGVTWFEEPVIAADIEGLRLLRDRAPAGMDIAVGEYGYDLGDFRRWLDAGAVDVLQADGTRCQGITGFRRVAALCEARQLSLSAHCAPMLNLPACASIVPLEHLEYFHDHVRIEHLLFDGVVEPRDGALHPDLDRPGLGLVLKERDADRFRI